ncbi:MAG: hypothetical protein ACR2IE_11675 [Candidatus Sumerlaeaceae bacterium]
MSTAAGPAAVDRNVSGILESIRDYLRMREEQAVRINPRLAGIIEDIAWVQVQNLHRLLERPKAFGGEKYRVADVLSSADDLKRKALLGTTDQNSIVSEIINRGDEQTKRVADLTIHDMRTLFRMIDPSLENIVQLIQHWIYWDLPDASDLHNFEEQARRLDTLRTMDLSEELRGKYRPAIGKSVDQPVSEGEVLNFELKRLESICMRFVNRRNEDEAFQMIIGRDDAAGEPYDYKKSQADKLKQRLEGEKQLIDVRLQPAAVKPLATPSFPAAAAQPASGGNETPSIELI